MAGGAGLRRARLRALTSVVDSGAQFAMDGSPRSEQEDLPTPRLRTNLVEQFVETLVMVQHGGDQQKFARHLATVQYAFVSLDQLRALLEHMQQPEMAQEEGCKSSLSYLDGGNYTMGGGFVELRQIASDTLQLRLTSPQIKSTSRVSEGVPVQLSRQQSADDASQTCWVGGIPDNTSVEQLKELMGQFGVVDSCSMRAKPGGSSYAFVKYTSASAAQAALGGSAALGGVQLKVDKVDYDRLKARRGRKASIGASNAVWEAARG